MVQVNEVSYSQKQLFNRYNVNLMSVIISDRTKYAGFIKDVSEEGLAFETCSFSSMLNDLSTNKIINLMLKMPSGNILNLNCAIIWLSKYSPKAFFKVGMKILDPPLKYRTFVKALQQV